MAGSDVELDQPPQPEDSVTTMRFHLGETFRRGCLYGGEGREDRVLGYSTLVSSETSPTYSATLGRLTQSVTVIQVAFFRPH